MAYFDCIDRILVKFFHSYGKLIGRRPLLFLLGSLIAAVGLSTGLVFIQFETDALYLFTPDASQARSDGDVVYNLFPTDYREYFFSRGNGMADQGSSVILLPKIGNNVLKESFLSEVLRFDAGVANLSIIDDDGTPLRYQSLCAMQQGKCLLDPVLQVYSYNASWVHLFNLTYPIHRPSKTSAVFTAASLGDVSLSPVDNSTVERAGLFGLSYPLNTTAELKRLCRDWEEEFIYYASNFKSEVASVSFIVGHSLEKEITNLTFTVLPFFVVTCSVLCLFAVMSCMVADWVRSKSTLAITGLISATLAVGSSSGLLCYVGVPFNIVAASMPFLIIGIGIDDMFIMLAAWRKSNPLDSVENRMGQTYSEAAVSITITSITDALAFGIGAISSLPAVRIFCLYTGVAVIFDYIFQITFFGSCMVYSGRREAANRHCITFAKVVPSSEAKTKLYKIFCAGGFSMKKEDEMKNLCETALMSFFRDHYGPALMTPVVRVLSFLLFAGYLAGAIYGFFQVTEGLELKSLAGDGSPTQQFFHHQAEYFSEYGPSVSVAILETYNYSDPSVQEMLEHLVQDFESSEYIHASNVTEFWLRDYLMFLHLLNLSDEVRRTSFMDILVEHFLEVPYFSKYAQDIQFKEGSNRTEIEAFRFLIVGNSLGTTDKQMAMMADVRQRAANFQVTAFSPWFIIYEQYVAVKPMTIQNVAIAIGSMFFVALLLIPHPFCAVMVTACIVSILAGIIGYMSLWKVRLDGISMINIILCIGFSVDFSAHITYAFLVASEQSPHRRRKCSKLSQNGQRAVMALYSLGMPILQGALSTILAILILYWSPSYIFRTFFKIMFMVMVLGIIHSLVFLPVLLATVGSCFKMSPVSVQAPEEPYKSDRAMEVKDSEEGKVFVDDGTDLRVYPTFGGMVTVL